MFNTKKVGKITYQQFQQITNKFVKVAATYNQLTEEDRCLAISQKLPKRLSEDDLHSVLNLRSSDLSFVHQNTDNIEKVQSDYIYISSGYGDKHNYWFLELRPYWMQDIYDQNDKANLMTNCWGMTDLAYKHDLVTANKGVFLVHKVKIGQRTLTAEFDFNKESPLALTHLVAA